MGRGRRTWWSARRRVLHYLFHGGETRMQFIMKVAVVRAGSQHFAATELGGLQVRGLRAEDPVDAVRNLLWKLANRHSGEDQSVDDAAMALELALEGTSIKEEMRALTDGTRDNG